MSTPIAGSEQDAVCGAVALCHAAQCCGQPTLALLTMLAAGSDYGQRRIQPCQRSKGEDA